MERIRRYIQDGLERIVRKDETKMDLVPFDFKAEKKKLELELSEIGGVGDVSVTFHMGGISIHIHCPSDKLGMMTLDSVGRLGYSYYRASKTEQNEKAEIVRQMEVYSLVLEKMKQFVTQQSLPFHDSEIGFLYAEYAEDETEPNPETHMQIRRKITGFTVHVQSNYLNSL